MPLLLAVTSPAVVPSSTEGIANTSTVTPMPVTVTSNMLISMPIPEGVPSLALSSGSVISELTNFRMSNDVSSVQSATRRVPTKSAGNNTQGEEVTTGVIKWSREATHRLIQLYKEHQHLLSDHHYKKKTIWEMIATKLTKESEKTNGMVYTWAHVGNRWKNVTKLYRDCFEANRNKSKSASTFHKCQFFNEIASVYKYEGQDSIDSTSKSKITSGTTFHSNKEILVVPTKSTLKRINYVHIAPKQSTESTECTGNSSVSKDMPLAKKVKCRSTPCPASAEDVLTAVRHLSDDHKIQENMFLARLEKMHNEKMEMFKQYLEIVKQHLKP